jgi:addiction module HigA family antidote
MTIKREDLEKTDFSDIVDPDAPVLPPVTPGEILQSMMEELGISARALARDIAVPVTRITEILHGERAVTADTAILLGRRLGNTAEFWMNLQTVHDLAEARERMKAAAGRPS